MLDLASLQKKFPSLTVRDSTQAKEKRSPAQPKHPRLNVLKLIENSIALLANDAFTVLDKKTNTHKTPEVCYKLRGDGTADITLTYAKKTPKLVPSGDVVTVAIEGLPELLRDIKADIESMKFDTVLLDVQKERSQLLLAKSPKNKAAGNTPKKGD